MHSPRLLPGTALLVTASATLALLHACQEARQPTEPDLFSTPTVAVDAHPAAGTPSCPTAG